MGGINLNVYMQPGQMDLIPAFYLAIPFFFLLLFVNWLGYRFKNFHIRKFPGTEHVGIGPTEGSLLGLTALLLSFTFGMSSSKFESRRQLIVTEANNIGTTILRCEVYPDDSVRKLLRSELKNYLESRIDYYLAGYDEEKIKYTLSSQILFRRDCVYMACYFSHDLNNRVASDHMIPAMNAMIDIVETREAARNAKVPGMIMIILCTLILVSAFLSGYGSKSLERNKVLVTAFAFITTLALYLVVDLDKPRQGFVNLNATNQLIINLRSQFNEK